MAHSATPPRAQRRRVVVVTRSLWSEPPRLRHQVARLLSAHGHEVLFVEKPALGVRGRIRNGAPFATARSGELVHHQLRVARSLSLANARVVTWSLASIARDWSDALVINFNYDYWMLRDLWPSAELVTIINDDFVNRSRSWARREAEWSFRRTLGVSDRTLTVSYPLLRQAQEVVPGAELFLPWARDSYRAPGSGERSAVLYWGYINDRLDWKVIRGLLDRGQRIHFVGPIERSALGREMVKHPGAAYHGVRALTEIPDVVAQCCCSILPYDLSRSHLEVTVSNRTFDLLACGLPVVHAAYPEWLEAPSGLFHPASDIDDYQHGIALSRAQFAEVQPAIESFLRGHTAEQRYRELTGIIV